MPSFKDQIRAGLMEVYDPEDPLSLTKREVRNHNNRVNQQRFDGGPFSDVPPPVKAQNKAAKNAVMRDIGGQYMYNEFDGAQEFRPSTLKDGRAYNRYWQSELNPNITRGFTKDSPPHPVYESTPNKGRINNLATPMKKLPVGMLGVAPDLINAAIERYAPAQSNNEMLTPAGNKIVDFYRRLTNGQR